MTGALKLLTVAALWLVCLAPVSGQIPPVSQESSPSHRLFQDLDAKAMASKILRQRLGKARDIKEAVEFFNKLDPELRRQLLDQAKEKLGQPLDLDDPALNSLIKKIKEPKQKAEAAKREEVKKEDVKKIWDAAQALVSPETPKTEEPKNMPPPGNQREGSSAAGASRSNKGPDAQLPGAASMPSVDLPADGRHRELSKWLLEQSDRLKSLDGPLGNSPGLRQAIRDLRRQSAGWENSRMASGLSRLGGDIASSRFWSETQLPKVGNLPWPSVPQVSLPNLGTPFRGTPAVSVPRIGPASSANPQAGLGLVWIVVLALLAVVLWKLLKSGGLLTRAAGGKRSWNVGPWPVSPQAVATRADLIKAFEYLSLLKLGPAARSHNHLTIAFALGAEEEEHRLAAEHLASLYEKARYAPSEDRLPDEAFRAARRELTFLAGEEPV